MAKYKALTDLLPVFEEDYALGDLVDESDFRWTDYSGVVYRFIEQIHETICEHADFLRVLYRDVVDGLKYQNRCDPLELPVSELHEYEILAILIFCQRGEHFSNGFLVEPLESGFIINCLRALRMLDES